MSYTVDIMSAPLPRSYDEAFALRDQRIEERDARIGSNTGSPFEEPSGEMRELHRRLTARFPCICDDPDGPWSDGPLINNFGQRAATLGISFSGVAEALPFLIATALEMGFWVLDGQDDVVHLPGGTVLRSHAAEPDEPARPWWRFWR